MIQITSISTLITIIGVLVALVNITTQVLKNVFPKGFSSSLLALIISVVITTSSGIAYLQYMSIEFVWYYLAVLLVLSIMVAYAAMFGFDKLKQILQELNIK